MILTRVEQLGYTNFVRDISLYEGVETRRLESYRKGLGSAITWLVTRSRVLSRYQPSFGTCH